MPVLLMSVILVVFLIWQNNDVVVTKYEYVGKRLPKGFDGLKILHISDLHNKNFHGKLYDKIEDINPDIIVITGDLIDRRRTNIPVAAELVKNMAKMVPVYYASGNHEQLSRRYSEIRDTLIELNVNVLDNSCILLNKNGDVISISGIIDPSVNFSNKNYNPKKNTSYVKSSISEAVEDKKLFNILLSHRPEYFDVYEEEEVNLVFSGHAHGGQIRIPFLGGVLSPDQGFFPEYSEGMHSLGETTMVVSRGLGNSLFPFRVFNRPELVVVTLKSE
ncbi:MAG TPA: metallophosphoesterase [Clostridiales bacterium]|nr:metallophosphoesterase [Clostridiales bacterium]